MPTSIVICEKNTQAAAIRAAVGNRFGSIYPTFGHAIVLLEPHETRPDEWTKWSSAILWPGKFYAKKISPEKRRPYEAIAAALRTADRVVIATDFDREGQLIGDETLEMAGFRGEVFRATFTAEDPKSISDAFAAMKPNAAYRGLYMAGQAREQADQTSNLTLTRAGTVTLREPGTEGAIGIGRVKTPVLGIVCKREIEIRDFMANDMFEVDADTKVAAGSLMLICGRMPASLVKEQAETGDDDDDLGADEDALRAADSMEGRILDRRIADGLVAAAGAHRGPVRSRAERKRQAPPKLFDTAGLQSACSTKFGWSGDRTMQVAQAIYDAPRSLITYPRGDSAHIPENEIPNVPAMIGHLTGLPAFSAHADLLAEPVVRKGKQGHFSDAARVGSSHHAIIPNINNAHDFARQMPSLTDDERALFGLIARQYLAALAPDYEYRQTVVTMTVPWKGHGWDFRASGRVPLVPGWKAILGGAGSVAAGDEVEMCPVRDGETGHVLSAAVRTVTTRPPARYTNGSLIRAMAQSWRLVDDPKIRERLRKAKGIGRPGTQGDIIKGLLEQRQIETKGKSLAPTSAGLRLYEVFLKVAPNLVDPGRTAVWETIFDLVEAGRMTAEDAVLKIVAETTREVDRIVATQGRIRIAMGPRAKPTPKMAALAKTVGDRKGVALPKGCLTDAATCRAFLDAHLPKRAPGEEDKPFPPSEKQAAFAERVALETGETIPEAAKASGRDLSAWIDRHAKALPARPPSEKQVAFAEKLADENGVEVPDEARSDGKACSVFIDGLMKKSGGGKAPTGRKGAAGKGAGKPGAKRREA